jgi:plastocyanin/uncharacterized membrane protein YhaH (DUF805 family)
MTRTFAMKVYAATYWVLAVLFVYVLLIFILPQLAEQPDQVGPFLPIIGGFLALFVIGAAIATFWRSARGRGWVWLALLIPPVLFLLMNAPFMPYGLTHPADEGFPSVLTLVVGTIVLVWAGVVAFREVRAGTTVAAAARRQLLAVALIAGATLGALATSVLAARAGGGSGSVAAAPTTTAILVAEGTKYLTTSYSIGSSDVIGLFVENRDSVGHSFDVDALNTHVQVPANSTVALSIKPTGVGPLAFYCAIPGHKEAGMAGTIDVK